MFVLFHSVVIANGISSDQKLKTKDNQSAIGVDHALSVRTRNKSPPLAPPPKTQSARPSVGTASILTESPDLARET